jgi:plasmid stabilization system protein ParE
MRQLDRRPSQISLTNGRWDYSNDNNRVLSDAVEVLRVLHASQQWPKPL